jgi:hypothetical protein
MSHRPLLLGALLFACLAPACLQANKVALEPTPEPVPQRDPTERLLELAQRDNRAMQHLRTLTQEFGPRLTGSERYDRAAQWCLEQFQSWGLQAHLETWGELPVRWGRCARGRCSSRRMPRSCRRTGTSTPGPGSCAAPSGRRSPCATPSRRCSTPRPRPA